MPTPNGTVNEKALADPAITTSYVARVRNGKSQISPSEYCGCGNIEWSWGSTWSGRGSGERATRKTTAPASGSPPAQYENASAGWAVTSSLLKNVATPNGSTATFWESGVRSGARNTSAFILPACASEYLLMKVR